MNVKKIALNGMLAAMTAVFGYIAFDLGTMKITLESLPVIYAGLMFGPASGALVGGIGVFIYQLLRYGLTVTTPLWILPYIVGGLAAGIYAKKYSYNNSPKELAFIITACELIFFILNTLAIYVDSKIFGYYSVQYVWGAIGIRLVICAAKSLVFSLFTPALLKRLSKITGNGR